MKPQFFHLAFLSLIVSGSVLGAADATLAKPNIILIMADDLGYAALGCYGQ
jgi:hypothetical protein